MKQVRGIYLPDSDTHFEGQIAGGPVVDGKGTYQFAKYQAALSHVRHRGHAVDVGAHVGLWSRVMALDFDRVTAFEPAGEHLECFRLNVTPEKLDLRPYAAGAKSGLVGIDRVADNSGNAHVGEGDEVLMVRLDDEKLAGVDLLKIDVEGYERDVIVGAERTIKENCPVLVVEQKPGHAERYGIGRWDAVNLLKSWGMKEVAVISGDHVLIWP